MNFKKDSIIYLVGEVLSKLTPFLLLPIISNSFQSEGVYLYTTYILIVFIIQSLFSGWLTPYLSLQFFKSKLKFNYLFSGSYRLFSVFSTFAGVIAVIAYLQVTDGFYFIVLVSLLGGSAGSICALFLTIKQLEKKPNSFVLFNITRSFFYLLGCLLILLTKSPSVFDFILLHAFSSLLFGGYSLNRLIKLDRLVGRFSLIGFIPAFKFGFPLLPGIVLNNLKTAIDRFYIALYLPAIMLGIYSAAYQLASIVMVLSVALTRAVGPTVLSHLLKGDYKNSRKVFSFFTTILFIGSLAVSGFIYFFGAMFLGDSFQGVDVFFLLPFVFFMQGVNGFLGIYYQANKQTALLLKLNIAGIAFYSLIVFFATALGEKAMVAAILISSLFSFGLVYLNGGHYLFDEKKQPNKVEY